MFAAFWLAACASTSLVGDWQNPGYSGPPLAKILVMGVSDDGSVRRIFENQFVGQLRARGVEGIPSHRFIAKDGQVEREQVMDAVKSSGADGVLITRVARVDRETAVTPGFTRATAFPGGGYRGYHGFYGHYSSVWATYQPPQVYQYEVVTLETNLWSVARDEIVWSGATESFAPDNLYKNIEDIVNLVTESLVKRQLI